MSRRYLPLRDPRRKWRTAWGNSAFYSGQMAAEQCCQQIFLRLSLLSSVPTALNRRVSEHCHLYILFLDKLRNFRCFRFINNDRENAGAEKSYREFRLRDVQHDRQTRHSLSRYYLIVIFGVIPTEQLCQSVLLILIIVCNNRKDRGAESAALSMVSSEVPSRTDGRPMLHRRLLLQVRSRSAVRPRQVKKS